MQSPLFNHAVTQSAERYSLQNAHMLRVLLSPEVGTEVLARKGAMVAYQGNVQFEGAFQSAAELRTGALTGDMLDLMRCHGHGTVYLANQAQSIHILNLHNDALIIEDENVLALDNTLNWGVVQIDAGYNVGGMGAYSMQIGGTGRIAITTSGAPLVLRASSDREVFADADAVIAWTAGLRTSLQAQTTSQRVWRRRRQSGEGWTIAFMGEGYVVVQPSEVLPVNTIAAQGNRFGMGRDGFQGNTWGGPGGPHGTPPPGPYGPGPQGPPGPPGPHGPQGPYGPPPGPYGPR
ncbi:AIM24 family protein [Embleya sp. NBC_00896]|uniref:AIM24 family protein n=1 Tax=Embleya sp. NBC_00896 TaxID=2975961 RepID=UPI003867820D|nr:AIM24 family protein [Embleya sp. NBC_00896]